MKILITGAGGFLGKRLTQYLARQGHKVIAVIHSMLPVEDRYYFASENVTILPVDLANLDCHTLPSDIEAIYSLAQSSHFRSFPEKAEDIFSVNITANFQLLQWANEVGVEKFIYASSGGIYGGKLNAFFQENDLLAVDSPLGFYLGSKLCAEIIFQNYRHFFQTAIILRPFFIYGAGQRKDMLIARLVEAVKNEQPIHLQGQDGLRMNPIYVNDAVIAFANALQLSDCHVINVAGPDTLTLREIGEIIGQATRRKPVFVQKPGAPVDYVGNIDQAVRKLNQTLTSFADGINLTIAPQNREA